MKMPGSTVGIRIADLYPPVIERFFFCKVLYSSNIAGKSRRFNNISSIGWFIWFSFMVTPPGFAFLISPCKCAKLSQKGTLLKERIALKLSKCKEKIYSS